MALRFERLLEPSGEALDCLNRWDNDPAIVHLIRPCRDQAQLEARSVMTAAELADRLGRYATWMIRLDGRLAGEMNYAVDPPWLFRAEPGTAWIGLVVGEESARGRGLGGEAMARLEAEIGAAGLKRIELGVFEFNARAIALYSRLGYSEIGRIPDFTWWDGRSWQDIRMEKRLGERTGTTA